jgi:hypothetical protein
MDGYEEFGGRPAKRRKEMIERPGPSVREVAAPTRTSATARKIMASLYPKAPLVIIPK